jgi:hypothetical protein
MLIVLGIIAFGQMFSYRIRLDNAAREGARTGVVGATDAVIIQKIQNRLNSLPGITTSCGTAPVGSSPTPGSACMSVAILPNTCAARTNGVDLVVTIRYEAYVTVPVIGFASFYVTGYTAQGGGVNTPCNDDGSDDHAEDPPGPGTISGHFITDLVPNAGGESGGASGEACDFDSLNICTAVMTK